MMRFPTLSLVALLFAAPLASQTPAREPAVVELPSSSRAMALGYAFQMDQPESDAVFYHPALASRAQGFSMGVLWLGGAARAFTVSAATSWLGGGVAVGLQALEYGARAGSGSPAVPGARAGGLDPLLADGPSAASDLVASLAYGRTVYGFRVGLTGKLVDQRLGGLRRQDLAADVGIARALGPGWAGLTVRNLGPERTFGERKVDYPTEVSLGFGAYGQPVGPLDLGLAAALTRRADGEVLFGGGVEFGWWPVVGRTFVARVGARNVPEGDASPLTFGGSFWGDDLVIEYALEPIDGRAPIHRVTLGWR